MMFSQLCKAYPRTLWNKVGIKQTTEAIGIGRANDIELNGDERCQLEHCKFCDFRVCCQEIPRTSYSWETKCLEDTDRATQVTENPAYGLSSKTWLDANDDDDGTAEIVNMESLENEEQNENCDISDESVTTNILPPAVIPSQQIRDCDANTVPKMNQVHFQSHIQQNKMELKTKNAEEGGETPKHEMNYSDAKHGKLTWSVLRHRQLNSDILRNCDNKSSNVIEHSTNDKNCHLDSQDKHIDPSFVYKAKKSIKDRSFPLSLMKPIPKISDKKPETAIQHLNPMFKNDLSRQRLVPRNGREKFQNPGANREANNSHRLSNDILGLNSNPLSDIEQLKTEESVQEWLARISEPASNVPDESEEKDSKVVKQKSPWNSTNDSDEEKERDHLKLKERNFRTGVSDILLNKDTRHSSDISLEKNSRQNLSYDDLTRAEEELDTTSVLCRASKASPANIPMVVMQCSRLHSHIGFKPPFQQTSLPMGTLVTALYQESDWLYVQTPHGIEGFVSSSNCVPIGTVNEPANASRRPWEPCDFPIQISLRKKHEFSRPQGSYIPAKLPTNNEKQSAPYVNTVKMKTNFYNDRYFNHTFKSKDSIKTAKTVTDILRSSPETKVSNQ